MTHALRLLRLACVLALAAGPLVTSVSAAGAAVWSASADLADGTVPPASDDAPSGDVEPEVSEEEAALWHASTSGPLEADRRRTAWGERPPAAPFVGAPTPPPDAR